MKGDREAVGFVADPLHDLQPGVVLVEDDRVLLAGHEYFFFALCQRHNWHAFLAELFEFFDRARELALAAVDHDQAG